MRLGLRAKSALALGVCIVIVLALAVVAGRAVLSNVTQNLGTAFARNTARYNKQRILAPVTRELALAQRLADSVLMQRFLLDHDDPQKKELFFAEAERYRQAFADKSYFLIARDTRGYYFNDDKTPFSAQPRYYLDPSNPNDAWFFATMKSDDTFNINTNPDVQLKMTKVWFNVLVKENGRNIGLAGTGLDLTQFLDRFIADHENGVTPMIVNAQGAIQAHPDKSLIDYATVTDKGAARSTIYQLLDDEGHMAMRVALQQATRNSGQIPIFHTGMNGRRQIFAVSALPELGWFVVTAVDLQAAHILDSRLWLPLLVIASILLALLVLAISIAVNRILLRPLLKLTNSAQAVAGGNYALDLPPAGHDELGQLTRAFGAMATRVRSHTDELESKVHERTRELVTVNEQMAAANRQIADSIQYARLIQNSILPDYELQRAIPGEYYVLWRPRDVVSGDYYIFRADEKGCLLGVVDCAGHGIAGAFMTMIAHSSLDMAMDACGLHDPAALLTEMDERLRSTLQNDPQHEQAATHMDAGLAYVDFQANTVTYSSAKIALYWSDGIQVGQLPGGRHVIGGRRKPTFENETIPLDPHATFTMTTDGLLDQAGGDKGYGFGRARFLELLRRCARQPLGEQRATLAEELQIYQGDLPQRDDITVLGFRFSRARNS